MQCRRAFEVQVRRRLVPLALGLPQQRTAAAFEEFLHTRNLGGVLLVGAALETRRQAHLHLGINAAGKGRIGIQVVDAAAHLEQVERVVGKLLGSNPRGERPEILRAALDAGDARRDRRARIGIVEDQLDQRRKTES